MQRRAEVGCGGVQGEEVPPAQKSLPQANFWDSSLLSLPLPAASSTLTTQEELEGPCQASKSPSSSAAACRLCTCARPHWHAPPHGAAFLADARGTPPCASRSAALSPSRCLRSAPAPAASARAVRRRGGVQQQQLRADRSTRLFVLRFHSALPAAATQRRARCRRRRSYVSEVEGW